MNVKNNSGQDTKSRVPRLLNEKEAALYLGVSVALLRQSRMKNPPPRSTTGPAFCKFRKIVRYRIEDLDAWLDEHRVDRRLPSDLLTQGAKSIQRGGRVAPLPAPCPVTTPRPSAGRSRIPIPPAVAPPPPPDGPAQGARSEASS